eukprot:3661765-Rhodomonas_salina.1
MHSITITRLALLVSVLASFFTVESDGAIITINTGNITWETLINSALSGDTIQFGSGTFSQLAGCGMIISKDLIIRGAGQQETILDCGGVNRHFTVSGSFTLQLVDITLTGGTVSGSNGGCITADSGAAIIASGAAFTSNTGDVGGAIFLGSTTTMTATSCMFSQNIALGGGAVYLNGGTLTSTNCSFSQNVAGYAGV